MTISFLNNIFSKFSTVSRSHDSNANQVDLCRYGQSEELTFLSIVTDSKSNHALAVIQATCAGTQHSQDIYMTCDQLREVLKSYNENGAEDDPKAQILHYAATLAQAHDSSLHKPRERVIQPQRFF